MYFYNVCTVCILCIYVYKHIWDKYMGFGKADEKSVTLGKTRKRS